MPVFCTAWRLVALNKIPELLDYLYTSPELTHTKPLHPLEATVINIEDLCEITKMGLSGGREFELVAQQPKLWRCRVHDVGVRMHSHSPYACGGSTQGIAPKDGPSPSTTH